MEALDGSRARVVAAERVGVCSGSLSGVSGQSLSCPEAGCAAWAASRITRVFSPRRSSAVNLEDHRPAGLPIGQYSVIAAALLCGSPSRGRRVLCEVLGPSLRRVPRLDETRQRLL